MHQSEPGEPAVGSARELLGVAADADAVQIARAYRRQARRFHPDISLEPDATERFWTLQAAYRVALDAVQRDVPRAPAQVAHHVPTVALGAPVSGVPATWRPARGSVPWLTAGPVRVQPPRRPDPGSTTKPAGERP